MQHTEILNSIVNPAGGLFGDMFIVHMVQPAHFAGGILIAIGLLTRIATAIQIPIFLGAVAVNITRVIDPQNFILVMVSLILCMLFIVIGSGKTFG